MALEQMADNTGPLMQKLRDAFEQWLNPVEHPTIRFRDVEDARQDVVQHVSQLARVGIKPGVRPPVDPNTGY